MSAIKSCIYKLVPILGRFFSNKLVFSIIYYHDVVNCKGYSLQKINIKVFEEQMRYFVDNGYQTLLFNEVKQWIGKEKLPDKKKILITFDDGYRSNYELVYPLMKKLGLKFNVFICPQMIEENDPNYLTVDMLKEMYESGFVEFGAHTYSHIDASKVTESELITETELCNSRILEWLGYTPDDFCYPYGRYTKESSTILSKYYKKMYTSDCKSLLGIGNCFEIGRIGISEDDSLKIFKDKIDGKYNIMYFYYKIKNTKKSKVIIKLFHKAKLKHSFACRTDDFAIKRKEIKKIIGYKYGCIPVVLGSNANALGIARSLGEKKVPVIVADHENGIAFHSKYAISIRIENCSENENGFINSMSKISSILKDLNKKGIIYCSSDAYLFAIGKNYELLGKSFIIPMSRWCDIERCLDKSYLYKEAARLNIPYPKTYYADSVTEIFNGAEYLQYPMLIKPAVTVGFSSVYQKAVIVNDNNQLSGFQKDVEKLGLGNYKLIMQEIIPGPVTNLYTYSSYSDVNGVVKAYSIGHKIRQSPPETGTITSGKVKDDKELAELGRRFIKGLNFHGIANTEFKLDTRDGLYKLIEINPRPGLWNYSATAAGVNLSWSMYENIVLGVDNAVRFSGKEIIWIYDLMDLARAVFSKKYGHEKYRISLAEWFKSVRGKKIYAIWKFSDPKPLYSFIINSIRKRLK